MHRTSIGILAALCVLSSTLALTRTQTPPPGTSRGSLEGLVIDTVTGQPIEGVQIAIVPGQALTEAGVRALLEDQKPTLQVPQITTVLPGVGSNVRDLIAERTAHSVLTDARGKFMFNSLAAGTYSLALRAEGYNFQVYGRKTGSLGSLPVNIGEGKTDAGVIRMNPESRLSGTVVDVGGGPIAQIRVYLLNAQPTINVDGETRFRVVSETLTDSDGHYALGKFAAGRFYVAAGGPGRPEVTLTKSTPDGSEPVRQPALLPYPYTFIRASPTSIWQHRSTCPPEAQLCLAIWP